MLDMKPAPDGVQTEITFASGEAELSGTLFLPPAAAEVPPRAAVVLNSATAIPQGYYRHFAAWLAREQGIACLTYDYRDFGRSARVHPRGSSATMAEWGVLDQPAARAEMRRRLPGVPLWVIGHSLGGMVLPLQEGTDDIERVICVASGMVNVRDHPWPYQGLARTFWFGHVPVVVRTLGYLPGWLSGFGVDLPGPVYWQWRKWCTAREFYRPEIGVTLPPAQWRQGDNRVEMIALSDDQVCPEISVHRLAGLFGPGEAEVRVLAPAEAGLESVGHLGAFTRQNAAIWPLLIRDR